MKPKVLQFINSFHQGGSERQVVQLTKLLHKEKSREILLACLSDEGVLRKEVEAIGFDKIPEFKLTSFYDMNFLRQVRKCAEFIRENKIEIVHTHDFYTNIFGMAAARLAKVKTKIASKRETAAMRGSLQKIIEKQAFKTANAITVNAEAVKNYLINENVPPTKIRVVYNGLDLERLTPKITDRREICEVLNLPAEKEIKFITLVANLRHSVKNQPMFLRVAQKVSQKFPEAHFVLAGEGELKSNLEKLAGELKLAKNMHFIGRCEQVAELLSISYACVLTSFAEGFSNSILEYMAASRPVVATAVGGASEAIVENETGFLVDSDDDKAMTERLIYLLKNPGKTLQIGEQGRARVEEKFSCEAQLQDTLDLYKSLSER